MKKIFVILSGRPKNGDVVECIRPAIAIPQLILASLMVTYAINYRNFMFGAFSIFFAWQIGWGMSIERFVKDETKNE